ncbi:lipoate--protein ligase family protein [Roseimaritima sediminicola]|uniref:lipoate--protein ligase family protein n=1 Tax=Roseimaritima sediminicola TaxID=2662066 RepID=UPI001298357E|nr:lipoate--protein ligase family protein [Roseimaritima sediminicola]
MRTGGSITGRVIRDLDSPGGAAWNMAVDQALLQAVAGGAAPTLRFYRWQEPTLSLGYFQSLADRVHHAASAAAPVVRRCSGGGAILHDRELTYSLIVPIGDRTSSKVQDLVRRMHDSIRGAFALANISLASVADSGVAAEGSTFLCFQRRASEDLLCAGYKVVGSAQRRTAGAVLQHGSILLAASEKAPELPGIGDLVGRRIEMDQLVDGILDQFQQRHEGVGQWRVGGLEAEERQVAQQQVVERFENPSWLNRRP